MIALAILKTFGQRGCKSLGLTDGYDIAFVTFAETACLLHDIGNPPFGHHGELSISEWFSRNEHELKLNALSITKSNSDWDRGYRDFTHFDGNPQGLRIVTRLQWHDDEFGLNLTATQIASMIKYPISTAEQSDQCDWVKAGVFQTEDEFQTQVWDSLGLSAGVRHPIVLIMDAADDIGYCMSDIEDALEKEIISYDDCFRHMNEFLQRSDTKWISDLTITLPEQPHGQMPLLRFRTSLTRKLTDICADVTSQTTKPS